MSTECIILAYYPQTNRDYSPNGTPNIKAFKQENSFNFRKKNTQTYIHLQSNKLDTVYAQRNNSLPFVQFAVSGAV